MFLFKLLSLAVARLPLRCALGLGHGLGFIFGSVLRFHRADAVEAMTRSFPEKSSGEISTLIRKMYRHLGMNIIEMIRLVRVDEAYMQTHIRFEGLEHIRSASDEGRGVCVLTAHLGNWELICTTFPHMQHIKLNVIAKPIKNRSINRYIHQLRGRYGLTVLPSRGAYRDCIRALRRGEWLGFVLDQNMIRREGAFVDFFGRPACTTLGLAHIAASTQTPVVPAFIIREPAGHHVVKFLPPLPPPPDKDEQTLIHATQQYTRMIEQMIREHPWQWIWIHRRWKTTPGAAHAS